MQSRSMGMQCNWTPFLIETSIQTNRLVRPSRSARVSRPRRTSCTTIGREWFIDGKSHGAVRHAGRLIPNVPVGETFGWVARRGQETRAKRTGRVAWRGQETRAERTGAERTQRGSLSLEMIASPRGKSYHTASFPGCRGNLGSKGDGRTILDRPSPANREISSLIFADVFV
jgi:hypothetical protein